MPKIFMSSTVLPVGFEVSRVFHELLLPKILMSGTVLPVRFEAS